MLEILYFAKIYFYFRLKHNKAAFLTFRGLIKRGCIHSEDAYYILLTRLLIRAGHFIVV